MPAPSPFQSSSDVSLRTHDGAGAHRTRWRDLVSIVLRRISSYSLGDVIPVTETDIWFQSSSDVSLRTHPGRTRSWSALRSVSIVLRRISSYSRQHSRSTRPHKGVFQSSSDVSLRTHRGTVQGGGCAMNGFNRPQTYLFVLTSGRLLMTVMRRMFQSSSDVSLRTHVFSPSWTRPRMRVSIVLRRISSYSHKDLAGEKLTARTVSIVLRRISSYSRASDEKDASGQVGFNRPQTYLFVLTCTPLRKVAPRNSFQSSSDVSLRTHSHWLTGQRIT